jgi:hypothetical protein
MEDSEFLQEAEKLGLDIAYLPSDRILELMKLALDAPQRIQDAAIDELNKAGF